MARFIPRHVIGRHVDEIVHIHEVIDRLRRVSPIPGPPEVRSGLVLSPFIMVGRDAGASLSGVSGVEGGPSPLPSLDPLNDEDLPINSPSISTLSEVEDGRFFHFDSVPPARTKSGRIVRLRTARSAVTNPLAVPHALAWSSPSVDVITCVRRQARKVAILALGHGGAWHRRPRRNTKSDIRCE